MEVRSKWETNYLNDSMKVLHLYRSVVSNLQLPTVREKNQVKWTWTLTSIKLVLMSLLLTFCQLAFTQCSCKISTKSALKITAGQGSLSVAIAFVTAKKLCWMVTMTANPWMWQQLLTTTKTKKQHSQLLLK